MPVSLSPATKAGQPAASSGKGTISRDAADAVQWREVIDAVLQRSEEAFPATTLGL